MPDIRLHIEQALKEIRAAIDRGDIDADEVEKLFLEMLGD